MGLQLYCSLVTSILWLQLTCGCTRLCSVFFPDSEEVMGWEVSASGLKSSSLQVFLIIPERLPGPLKDFLAQHNLKLGEIRHWVSHPEVPR